MIERERLIELIAEARLKAKGTIGSMNNFDEWLADYLIERGVIVPPCKIGDMVYRICGTKKHHFVAERIVMCIEVYEYGFVIGTDGAKNTLGKTVFLTREEAEAALGRRHTCQQAT